jgi:hypothetical protein
MSRMVHIAIWPIAHDPLDAGIKLITHGTGGHASFVRGNGKIAENFWPHVHERLWKPGESRVVRVFRIEGLTPEGSAKLEVWIDKELAHPAPYSIKDLLRYAVDMPPAKGRGCFCSQWVLRGLRETQPAEIQPLVRLQYQDFGSPTQLLNSPRLHEVHVTELEDDEL